MRKRLIALLCVATMVLTNVVPTYAADVADVSSASTEESQAVSQTPKVELSKTSFQYNGIEQTPVITAYDKDGKLVSDEYYTVTYPETSIDAGEYTVEVVFSGPYTGTVTADYEITPIKFSDADFSIPATTYLYTGEAIEPVVNSKNYVKDVDYTVAYKDNVLDGTATVTITGIGNYADTTTLTFEIDLFYYDVLANNKICVTEVSKNVTGAMAIPSRYDGYSVTAIADEVFKSCKKLTSITTPDTLTSIGENAFYGCTGLTTVKLNGTDVSLENRAFYNCRELQSVIAEDLQSIGEYCFDGCNKLETVEVEDGIDSIGTYAFNRCLALKTVDIGTSIRSIGANAFYQCPELVSIGRLGNVEYIGGRAFYECEKLASIDLGFSRIVRMEGNIFYGCESLKEVDLPSTLENIDANAFSGCKSLEAIELPNNLTDIGREAFSGCTSLTSIVLPDSVTSVSYHAFKGCTKLETIRLSEGLPCIGEGAFSYCTSLKDVVIPEYVRTIEGYAFQGCTSLTSVTFPDDLREIGHSVFSYCTSLESIKLPAYLDTIGNYAFYECSSLKSIEIPEWVRNIGIGTFGFCSSLTTVILPDKLKTIRVAAFADTISLHEIELPEGLTTIEAAAFRGSAIKTLRIPASVETIATNGLGFNRESADTWIEAVYFPATTPSENIAVDALAKEVTVLHCYKNSPMHKYALDNGYAYVLIDGTDEDNLISGTDGQHVDWKLDKATGKLTVNTSGDMPGGYCPWKNYGTYITSLEITGDTSSVSCDAFSDLWKLESAKLPDTVVTIGYSAFNNCKHLESIMLPERLEVIEPGAFEYCNRLKEITIPYMVRSLQANIFDGALEKIIITNKNLIFSDNFIVPNENLKIYGHPDSTARTFAENNHITFVNLEEHEHDWVETVIATGDNKGRSVAICCQCGEVKKKLISDKDVWLEYEMVTYFFGHELRPTVLSDDLKENVDFTVSYSNNVNLGTATVTITGTGIYTGTVIKTFTIEPIDISDKYAYFSEDMYIYYDGTAKTPKVTIDGLEENIDFIVEYADNISAGTATVTITGKGTYAGIIIKPFYIEPVDISDKSADLSSETYTYDGIAKTPTVTIAGIKENIDFTVEYADNISAGTATVTIRGNGNYKGMITKTFTIEPVDISDKSADLSGETYPYDGIAKTPLVTIAGLEEDTDFTVEYEDNIDVGTATVTIRGKDNYRGTITKTFTIEPIDISDKYAYFSEDIYIYDGTAKTPKVTIDGLEENIDFIVEYTDNINVGTATVTITGKGNYTGTITKTFYIGHAPAPTPVDISYKFADLSSETYTYDGIAKTPLVTIAGLEENTDFTVEYANNINVGTATVTITGVGFYTGTITRTFIISACEIAGKSVKLSSETYTYDGTEKTPKVTIDGLEEGKDFTVEYTDNIDVGTATVTITGKGNYRGTITRMFTIEPAATIGISAGFHGNGGVFTVKHSDDTTTTDEYMIAVEIGGTMAGEGYTFVGDPVIRENPDRAFLGWLPCTMTKDYKEDGSFEYVRTPVEEATVLTTQEMLNYIIPECEAFVFLAQWECEEHDFNEWNLNTPATTSSSGERTRKCTVCGKIERQEIAQISSSVTLSKTSYTYTGSVLEPIVIVQDVTGKKLTLNTDYTVKYSSNVNVGTASVSVTFKGDYAGESIKTTFKINPVEASKLTAALSKTTYTYNGKTQTPSVSVKNGSKKTLVKDKDYTIKYASGRKNVGKYSVKITYKGNYSGTKTLYYKINPKTTSIKSLTSASKGFSVKWGAVSTQTTGYQIRYSKSSAMSGAKTVTVRTNKTTSIKVKNMSAKKTYYVQVRTYKTVNGVNYYSGWSSKKSVKTK